MRVPDSWPWSRLASVPGRPVWEGFDVEQAHGLQGNQVEGHQQAETLVGAGIFCRHVKVAAVSSCQVQV